MEFKKLSAVESVESVSEDAHVLIEENGVIKKAPPKMLAGGGDGGYFVVFDGNQWNDEDGSYSILSAPENLYQKLQECFANHTAVFVVLYNYLDYGDDDKRMDYCQPYGLRKIEDRFSIEAGSYIAYVHADGRIQVQYYD